jgi:hypothetical protein
MREHDRVDGPDAEELQRRLDMIIEECENANGDHQHEDVRGWVPAALVIRLARGWGYPGPTP